MDIEEYRMDLMKCCYVNFSKPTQERMFATFMEWINSKNFGSMEELIDAAEYDEEEERKYWIARRLVNKQHWIFTLVVELVLVI